MITWAEFETEAPEIAQIGKDLFYHPDRGMVAILATADHRGRPHVAPVSPIFCDRGIYLSVGAHTPKVRDFRSNGHYAMHARVGSDDLGFQITGPVRPVESAEERDAVVSAIPFPSFEKSDPIFELLIDRAVVVTWPERTTRGRKSVWSAS